MLKKYLIPTIAAVIALAACSKEIQEQRVQPADSDNVHTLSVEIESGAYEALDEDTKASMEAVIRVKWKQGDEVSVVNASKNKLLGGCLKAASDGENVVFEGTVTGAINLNDKLYYIYPRIKNNANEESFVSCDVSLAGQIYDGENIGNVCFYGYAEDQAGSTDKDISKKIKFNLVTSYAQLSMANLPAKNSGLSRIDISNVNEGFTWQLTGEVLSAAAYAGNNAISARCGNVNISKAGNAVIRFAIPASDVVSEARVITVNNAYKNEKYTKNKLEPSAYYNQLYTTWTENVAQVNTTEDPGKTKVTIDNNNSKDVAEGAIPTDAFGTTGQTSKPTEVSIGGMGTVTFDKDATARILGNADDAGATSVLFKVEDVTTTKPVQNADVVYEVTMKTLDETGKEVFPDATGTAAADKPGTATISINLDPDVMYVHTISLVKDDGTPIDGGVIPESIVLDLTNHILTFKVEHFSKYAVGYVKGDDFISVTDVSLDNTLTLLVGGTETLVATVTPDNATNKKVKWTSSNTAVATVDKDGKVAAVAHGTATITVTTEDGNKTAACIVTVPETKTMAELLATNPDIPEVDDLTPPANAWVNSTDPTYKAFVGKDGGKKYFVIKKEGLDLAPRMSVDDTFEKVDDNTYKKLVNGVGTFTIKMTEGKFTSYEFTAASGSAYEVLNGTYAAEYVEIGGLKWATKNLGASKPEDYGKYFQWGDVTGHVCNGTTFEGAYNFQWSNTPFHIGTKAETGWTKYIPNKTYKYKYWSGSGEPDNKTVLEPDDDAASKINSAWRMPTTNDFVELFNQCYAEWGTYNGVNGLIVYKAKDGDAGYAYFNNKMNQYSGSGNTWNNTTKTKPSYSTDSDTFVFFPAAGFSKGTSLDDAGSVGSYWSSSIYTSNPDIAYDLNFSSSGVSPQHISHRYTGRSFRPVSE